MLALDGPEIADAAADVGADVFADLIGIRLSSFSLMPLSARRFIGGRNGVMDERAHLARLFLLE